MSVGAVPMFYYRNRYYSPQTGRFISEDPIGYASGQTNAYAYVGGNPIQSRDPFGLAKVMPGGLIDDGASCKPLIPPPNIDDNGCMATGGGVSICIGPGTVRTVASTLAEQLALDAAKAGAGERIMQGLINDSRYPGDVWAKMQYVHPDAQTGKNIVIHYWNNLVTGVSEGFKFK
ncbi:RHS repeat-associated core domain-containing protein [Paraburkholderia agricolaris]|jgi:uncharacterized protein RhaS with RHS repeats|uniref:RHS repeat-associated core domain-containing protein n=2 Tax=Paraburkholderia agricolaris TaxID=2152888 RepID=UPI001290B796|nr:RHS repeat-associated core domain-containing protein [Paraburkholderia agricolaris]